MSDTNYDPNMPNNQDEPLGTPLTIVSFCIPLVGIILYFVNKDKAPAKAKTACYAALGGAALGIVVRVATMAAMQQ